MKLSRKLLMTTVVCTFCTLPTVVDAETMVEAGTEVKPGATVTTKTIVEPQKIEGVNGINFSAFDTNKDGLYSKAEVGEKLFYVFDRDGNEVIDNQEWHERNVYTITPMEEETYTFVDYDGDGYTELSSYTYDQFYKESALILFDKNKNGLSAAEFIAVGFQELDDNDNNTIELDEWKEAYEAMTKPEAAEQERYN